MLKEISLVSNHNGTYDILIEYKRDNVEFGLDFDTIKKIKTNSHKILEFIKDHAKDVPISSVKIIVSGVVVATMAFSAFLATFAATDRYSMGYLYSGTDQQQIEYVNRTNGSLDTVSPSYFDIQEDGSVKLNYLSKLLISTMHVQGVKVVPFLSNHWNRTAGINALQNVELLSTQIANYIEEYNLDGVNVDIENVTQEQRNQYTEFVRLLRQKVPAGKEISVAVAANPNDWQTGWHGSYDYAALSQHADHLLIMAYDEHYEGGSPGPVASIDFVENSIKYALTKTTSNKIVVGIPLYGRMWSLDSNRIVGKGVRIETINEIIKNSNAIVTYDEKSQSVKAEFEINENSPQYTVGGDFVLAPGRYVVWYENDQSYNAKLNLISKYDLKGAGTWSLGQEDPSIWTNYEGWLNGEPSNTTEPSTPIPENPDTSDTKADSWINDNETSVQIYKNKNLKGKIIDVLTGGTALTIIKNMKNGVYQVKLPNNQIGYVPSKYVTIKNTEIIPPKTNSPETSIPSEPSQEYITYGVQSGDTLWKIAERYLGSGSLYTEIKKLNGLNSDVIYPGMQLKIPANKNSAPSVSYTEYTVKNGDSLWKIAQNQLGTGTRYTEIKALNGLIGDILYPGQILKLPNK